MGKRGTGLTGLIDRIDEQREKQRRDTEGAERYKGARLEWNRQIARQQEDVPIEELLRDPYYLGSFHIWPAVQEEIAEIWHLRCDYSISFHKATGERIHQDTVYALSFEHACRRALEKWPRHARTMQETGGYLDCWRDRYLHTVVIETPKGTGKDFEMGLILWLLVREFLVQDRQEFLTTYELDSTTTISINCMNRTEDQAKKVTFKEVLPKFNTPFFNDYFPPQVDIDDVLDARQLPGELRFPRNVVIFPGTGAASTGLGYTIGAAVIDECNFLAKSDSAKRSIFGRESYDAADEIYLDAHRRHFSRLSAIRKRHRQKVGQEVCAGLIVCISSSRTKLDFTKRMETQARTNPGIFYRTSAVWDRRPMQLCGETFEFDLQNMSVVEPKEALSRYEQLHLETMERPQ